MEELHKRFADILKENTSLRHQIVDLQSALDFKEQELAMAKETSDAALYLKRIEVLEQENRSLRNMVGNGSSGQSEAENIKHDESGVVIGNESENICNKEIKLGAPEDELRRYLKTIREYITGLTGYRMEFREGEIIFHSLYAFDTEDIFIFRYRSGNMELVNNEFARTWPTEIQNYLVSGKSIPAFLAAVTLELFNKKTFG